MGAGGSRNPRAVQPDSRHWNIEYFRDGTSPNACGNAVVKIKEGSYVKRFLKYDFVIILSLCLLLVSLVAVEDSQGPVVLTVLRVLLGVSFVLFIPGYALQAAIFPQENELDMIARAAVSVGLSFAVSPLLALVLFLFSFPISFPATSFGLALFILACMLVALVRRRRQSAQAAPPQPVSKYIQTWWDSSDWFPRILAGIIVIAFLIALGATFLFLQEIPTRHLTEFAFLDADGNAVQYTQIATAGQSMNLVFFIANWEGEPGTYRIVARANGDRTIAITNPILLPDKTSEKINLRFPAPEISGNQRIEFLLERSGSPFPYRTLQLWLDIKPDAAAEPPTGGN
jgi:uncharacterized membrane protein